MLYSGKNCKKFRQTVLGPDSMKYNTWNYSLIWSKYQLGKRKNYCNVKLFLTNVFILYPLKVLWCFQGVWNKNIDQKWANKGYSYFNSLIPAGNKKVTTKY